MSYSAQISLLSIRNLGGNLKIPHCICYKVIYFTINTILQVNFFTKQRNSGKRFEIVKK